MSFAKASIERAGEGTHGGRVERRECIDFGRGELVALGVHVAQEREGVVLESPVQRWISRQPADQQVDISVRHVCDECVWRAWLAPVRLALVRRR